MPNTILPTPSDALISRHLDQPGVVVAASFGAAIAAILADAAADQKLDFLGFKLDLSGAYGVAGCAFLVTAYILSQTCWRIADLVRNADEAAAPGVLSALFAHSWPLNPFAYFGPRRFAILHAGFGMALLVVVWWTTLIALVLLKARWGALDGFDRGLFWAYAASGGVILASIGGVHWAVARKLALLSDLQTGIGWRQTRGAFRQSLIARWILAVLASGVGAGAYSAFTHIGM